MPFLHIHAAALLVGVHSIGKAGVGGVWDRHAAPHDSQSKFRIVSLTRTHKKHKSIASGKHQTDPVMLCYVTLYLYSFVLICYVTLLLTYCTYIVMLLCTYVSWVL